MGYGRWLMRALRKLCLCIITVYIALCLVHSSIRIGQKLLLHGNANQKPRRNAQFNWTYRCESGNCARYRYSAAERDDSRERRVPFETCSRTCGDVKVWPLPTGKTFVGRETFTFSRKQVQLHVRTPHDNVRTHLQSAFELFLRDLKRLEYHNSPTKSKRELKTDLEHLNVLVEVQKHADLHINLSTDESYQITIASEERLLLVHIIANSFYGARHAFSTLEQLIWYDDEHELLRINAQAHIVDAPKFRYRGLLLDTSRHYFTVKAIKRTIMAMSHAKLNRFHWHITDSQSFPYISQHYPELAYYGAYSDWETYTPDNIREVVAFAKLHGVQVIPEIDAPAHAGNGWQWGPERGLGELSMCVNQQPWDSYCGEPPCGQLNPQNSNTFLILQRLYEELLSLTGPTDYFHLGGDEMNLNCWAQHFKKADPMDLWCKFMLNAMSRLKTANNNTEPQITAVWSSGLTQTRCLPSNKVAVQIWFGNKRKENSELLKMGYYLLFSHVNTWYLDCGFGNWRSVDKGVCSPYRTWQTVYINRPWTIMQLNQDQLKQVLGGEVCLWTEQVNEQQLDNRLWPRSAALAERLWSDPDGTYEADIVGHDIFTRMSLFRQRLTKFGIQAESIFPTYCEQNPRKC